MDLCSEEFTKNKKNFHIVYLNCSKATKSMEIDIFTGIVTECGPRVIGDSSTSLNHTFRAK